MIVGTFSLLLLPMLMVSSSTPTVLSCLEDEFRCEDNSQCINRYFACNGYPHCLDSSDERDCAPCIKPEIKNERTSTVTPAGTSMASGESFYVFCQANFEGFNGRCNNGTWTEYPRCDPVAPCIKPEIKNERTPTVTPAGTSMASGEYFDVFCQANFQGFGGECYNGTWTEYPRCDPVAPCIVQEIKNARLRGPTQAETLVGHLEELSIDCLENFAQVGGESCYNGTWNYEPRCEPVAPCIVPEVKNARLGGPTLAGSFLTHGEFIRINCLDKFVQDGGERCNNGTWQKRTDGWYDDTSEPRCDPIAPCIVPEIKNARLRGPTTAGALIAHGEGMRINCLDNFLQVGGERCNNGTWGYGAWENPRCEPVVPCMVPTVIDFGRLTDETLVGATVDHGALIEIECQEKSFSGPIPCINGTFYSRCNGSIHPYHNTGEPPRDPLLVRNYNGGFNVDVDLVVDDDQTIDFPWYG